MVRGENIGFLNQLAGSLEKAELKLEDAYNNQKYEEFNKLKKFILDLQKRISEILE